MKRINVLTEETSNKIAAGEVVERPSSVVKELVENSIDANAKNITVEIFEGGHKSIRILDDGTGIHPDDIEKAFMPHATSKINSIEDIYAINTLGFRGEALASIAAVSNTILKSRVKEFDFGKELYISGGKINHIKETGMNVGTLIEVNDIFFNVPARLKFLKSPVREGGTISEIISKIALCHSEIAFKLFNNSKNIFSTFGNGNSLDCIRSVYGKSTCENLIYFENHNDIASVHGYIGNSELSRGSRNNQTIFVNGRYIKSKLITAAVENAFKSFLTINKFPFFILYIDIFPEFVDVNIHPTKSEIKFQDDRMIFKVVFDSVHAALKESFKDNFNIPIDTVKNIPEENIQPINYFEVIDNKTFSEKDNNSIITIPLDLKPLNEIKYETKVSSYDKPQKTVELQKNTENLTTPKEIISSDEAEKINNSSYEDKWEENPTIKEAASINTFHPKFPSLQVIGQFNNTYILAQHMEELYIIDQHAAHEKIIFEKYIKEIQNNNIVVQILLTPQVLELSIEDYYYFVENVNIFKKTGFDIEIFGDNTITIREVPYILGRLDIKNFFLSILDNLKNMGSGKTSEVKYNAIAKMACKSAIKANDSLSNAETTKLLEDLRMIEEPFTCPHGRPTIIKMTLFELEKRFKRIQ